MSESVVLDEGIPVHWAVTGNSTFGNEIDEGFSLKEDGTAHWKDSTGEGTATVEEPTLYAVQSGTPYQLAIYARALLADEDMTMPVLPAGAMRLEKMEDFRLGTDNGSLSATSYALVGTELDPTYFVMDGEEEFVAVISPEFLIVREGLEEHDKSLRERAVRYSTERFEQIQAETAHTFDAPVRITNVRIFDPETMSLSELSSVLVEGNEITMVEAGEAARAEDEYVIDGQGGTLEGKQYMLSLTFNAPKESFDDPAQYLFEGRGVDDLFMPAHMNFRFFGMSGMETFVCYDVMKNPDVENDLVKYKAHLAEHFPALQ